MGVVDCLVLLVFVFYVFYVVFVVFCFVLSGVYRQGLFTIP